MSTKWKSEELQKSEREFQRTFQWLWNKILIDWLFWCFVSRLQGIKTQKIFYWVKKYCSGFHTQGICWNILQPIKIKISYSDRVDYYIWRWIRWRNEFWLPVRRDWGIWPGKPWDTCTGISPFHSKNEDRKNVMMFTKNNRLFSRCQSTNFMSAEIQIAYFPSHSYIKMDRLHNASFIVIKQFVAWHVFPPVIFR